jgi:hypothetical protein
MSRRDDFSLVARSDGQSAAPICTASLSRTCPYQAVATDPFRRSSSETRSLALGFQQRLGVGTHRLDFEAAPVAFHSRLGPGLEERRGVGPP